MGAHMNSNRWSKEELIVALNLYLRIPFGKIHSHNPDIMQLANLIGRSANSVSMRLSNYASCDPYHANRGVGGLTGGKNVCMPIWNEFINNKEKLIYESEMILAILENTTLEDKYNIQIQSDSEKEGREIERLIKTRVNQAVFRKMVLSNYRDTCALTGIDIPDLLVASHIIPWSISEKERLNPENGICLSALYDRAFDKGLIGVSKSYNVLLSSRLLMKAGSNYFNTFFKPIERIKIAFPEKYLPKKEFLEYHLDTIFKG
jgi:putative restriction endonuclease